jgi:hypothetical protein
MAYEIVEVGANTFHKIKKKLWENGEWVDRTFLRLLPPDGNRGNVSEMEKWCRKTYGEPRINGPWFKASSYIIMDEKVYVFWKLCE